jgi:nucleoside 2-deoxyribosyltransferase
LDYDDATSWRNQAATVLAESGISAYSPMRAKQFLAQLGVMPAEPSAYAGLEHPLATSKGIMTRDHNDCVRADAVLFNFKGVTRISLGTAFEAAWCHDRHIPTVVVAERDNPNIAHPMAAEIYKFVVPTLEEALVLIKTILLPGGAE